jgi:hypothetical protein
MTTWTPATKQNEIWNAETPGQRVFDPAVFDNAPIFDTGQAGGYWPTATKQNEIWTPVL